MKNQKFCKLPLIYFFLGVLGFLASFVVARIDDSYFSSIYSSTFENSWDTTDSLQLFRNIYVSSKNDVFVAASNKGIIIIRDNSIILQQALSSFVQDLFITQNGRFIFVDELSSLTVYEFIEESTELTPSNTTYRLERIFQDKSHSSVLIEVEFTKDETRAIIALQEGLLLLLDISQIESRVITIIDETHVSGQMLRGLKMSGNTKWVVFTDYAIGIVLLRWKEEDGQINSIIPKQKLDFEKVFEQYFSEPYNQVLSSDGRFLFYIDFFAGLTIFDFKSAQDAYESADLSINSFEVQGYPPVVDLWWPTEGAVPNSEAISFSRDESLLAIAERTVAVYIVDIRDPANPQLFQRIQADSFSMSTAFSKDSNENYLYYSNGNSVLQYVKQVPNLNTEIPNLYNVHRSTYTRIGNNIWGWVTKVDSKGEFLFFADCMDGFQIIDLKKSALLMGQQINIDTHESFTVNFALIGENQEYAAMPSFGPNGKETSTTMMDIYDISNRYSPKLLFSIKSDSPSYSYSIDMHQGKNLLIYDNLSFLFFVDTSGLPNSVNVIRIWEISNQYLPILDCLAISYDGQYVMLLKRGYAIALLDISDITGEGPRIVDTYFLTGGDFVSPGKYQYTKYMFLADGLSGIKIIDQMQFPRIIVVSSLKLRGYVQNIALFQNGDFCLVSCSGSGQTTLIDLRDILNPQIVSSFQYKKTQAQFISIIETGDFFFTTTTNGIIAAPLFSQTFIHTDIQKVMNSETGTPTMIKIEKDTVFQVGQIINFNFIILRPILGISIMSVNYLQNYDIIDLPYWMTYNRSNQQLQMKIVKDSLGQNYSSNSARIEKNTIIVKTNRPVLVSDFHFNLDAHDVVTTQEEAQLIWDHLRFIGYLDKRSYVTNLFEYENAFSFTIEGVTSSDKLHAHVKVALQESIMFNPIIFSVKASLSINVMPTNSNKSDSDSQTSHYLQFIETLSEYVYLYLSIDKSLGKFVTRTYTGIITSTTDTFDSIKLEGDPISINKVLTQKVEIFIYDPLNSGQISLRLTDSNNYEIKQIHSINQVSFLSYLPSVSQNPGNRIQDQVNKKFPNSEVDIKTNIDIELMPTSFTFPPSSTLKYSSKQIFFSSETNSNSTADIPKEFWLQFQETSFKFSGVATFSDYKETYCFQVNATDSYSWQTDSFCIVASGVPFFVALNIIIQFGGPVLFIIGLNKYKHILYNIMLSKRNFYPDQKLKVGEYFEMRTLFIGQNLIIAHMIFEQFLEQFKKQSPVQKTKSFSLAAHFKRRISQMISDSSKLCEDNQQKKARSPSIGNDPEVSVIERTYLNPDDKTLLFDKFIEDLMKLEITINLNGNILKFDVLKRDLRLQSNILRACLRNELARYLLAKDKLSSQIYEDMKRKGLAENSTDQKDQNHSVNYKQWYTMYVKIDHTKDIEEDGAKDNFNVIFTNEFLYPRVFLKDTQIEQFFANFEKISNQLILIRDDVRDQEENGNSRSAGVSGKIKEQSDGDFSEIKRKRGENNTLVKVINRVLIKEVIMFDALGFDVSRSSKMFPNAGESLHLNEHEIQSVEAFVKSQEKTYFSKLFRLLNLEYVHITSHQNRKIPSWINFQLKSNMLLLEGTPTEDDKSEVLIRFYDYRWFIVKQFLIYIDKESISAPQSQTASPLFNDARNGKEQQQQISIPIGLTEIENLKPSEKKQEGLIDSENNLFHVIESIETFSEITSFQSTPKEFNSEKNEMKFPIEMINSPFAFRDK